MSRRTRLTACPNAFESGTLGAAPVVARRPHRFGLWAGLAVPGLGLAGMALVGALITGMVPGATPSAEAAAPSAEVGVQVTGLAVGRGVENRLLVGQSDRFAVDGGRLWAHVTVKNPGPATTVTMVWRRAGKERFRTALDVGTSPAWRTWSRVTPSPKHDTGAWEVEVQDAAGTTLATVPFEVTAPESADLGQADPTEGESGC